MFEKNSEFSLPIPDRILTEMKSLAPHLKEVEWKTVKILLLRSIPSNLRKLFSRRRDDTKQLRLNEFEQGLIHYWNENFESKIILSGEEEII